MTRRLLIASSIYNGVLRLLAVACGAATAGELVPVRIVEPRTAA